MVETKELIRASTHKTSECYLYLGRWQH